MPENPMEMLFGGGGGSQSGPAYMSRQVPMVEDTLLSMIFGMMPENQRKALQGSKTGFGQYLTDKWGGNQNVLNAFKMPSTIGTMGQSGYNLIPQQFQQQGGLGKMYRS